MVFPTCGHASGMSDFNCNTFGMGAGGLLQGINEDAIAVQNAISDKASNVVHQMSTFVAGEQASIQLRSNLLCSTKCCAQNKKHVLRHWLFLMSH